MELAPEQIVSHQLCLKGLLSVCMWEMTLPSLTCFFCMFCISSYSTLCCSTNGGRARRAREVPSTQAARRTNHSDHQNPFSPTAHTGSGTISVRPTSRSTTVSSTSSNYGR